MVSNPLIDQNKLKLSLESARLGIPAEKYQKFCIIGSIGFFALMLITALLLSVTPLLNAFPLLTKVTVFIFLVAVVPVIFYVFLLYYPKLVAEGRKNKINTDLPHAITYIQALSNTLNLFSIFKSVHNARNLYGEVSRECSYIVRDVEVFGCDLITAIENVKSTTPSKEFAELLNDMIMVYRSGGSISEFFAAKSETYEEKAKMATESSIQFLEMIAEVFVTVFVAGPIAFMIMLVSQSLSGSSDMAGFMPLMYLGLPVGGLVLIIILYVVLPSNTLKIVQNRGNTQVFSEEIIMASDSDAGVSDKFQKLIDNRNKINQIIAKIKKPKLYYISTYNPSFVLGGILALIVLLLWMSGIFGFVFPKTSPMLLICLLSIAFMLPVTVAEIMKSAYINGIEKQLPDFLHEISELKAIGMTLFSAIKLISQSKKGGLTSDLKIVAKEVEWGSTLPAALTRMENRVGLINVKRSVSLLIRASEVTDYVQDVLAIAVADVKNYLYAKRQRFTSSFAYLAIIYLSFAIYLFTAYTLLGTFVSTFSTMDITLDVGASTSSMFIIAVILAFISGLMAGQMSSNSVYAGLKHCIVMLILTIIIFVFVL